MVSVKQSETQGRGKERKGDTKAIAGSLEHCSFAFAGKQINERYRITLHQQTCAGEVRRPVMNRMYTSTKYDPLPNNRRWPRFRGSL